MFEYYENKLCVEAAWLFEGSRVMSESNYKKLRNEKLSKERALRVVRPNAPGQSALVEYASLPERFKRKVEELVGDPHRLVRRKGLEELVERDGQAVAFYSGYLKPDGQPLSEEQQLKYTASAEVLWAVGKFVARSTPRTRTASKSVSRLWERASEAVNALREKLGHNLPTNPRRLQAKYKAFAAEGYTVLVHQNMGNVAARVVTDQIEHLILCLYADKTRPFATTVRQWYNAFAQGEIDVADPETGELFDRSEFMRDGLPVSISDSTVWRYLNMPRNRAWVDRFRMDAKEYNDTHAPYVKRHSPNWALSKVSLDDRDLPRKLASGERVKAYYAYDVMSGACIGADYSHKKDAELFIGCFRDMFRFLWQTGSAIPLEVEVEHHLANLFEQDLLKAENLFPYVRWCVPGNSQEKRAEHFIKVKKYGHEKRYQEGVGRWYAKSEAFRTRHEMAWDSDGMKLKEKRYQFDRLVADDRAAIDNYNNAPHRDQKRFPGKTRLQVFLENQNPGALQYAASTVARYVGIKVETSLTRSKYLRANNAVYELPHPGLIAKLAPNNYKLQAYYMPTANGIIPEVHVYQDSIFVGTCPKTVTFNEAAAEQTDTDRAAMLDQLKYNAEFRKLVKTDNPIKRVERLEPAAIMPYGAEAVAVPPIPPAEPDWADIYVAKTGEDF